MLCLSLLTLVNTYSQGDSSYLSSTVNNASKGSFTFELMNVVASQLSAPQALWVYGDGNFELKLSNASSASHPFRIFPTEETTLYNVGFYDDGNTEPGKTVAFSKPSFTTFIGNDFTPTGMPVETSGLVSFGHYGALRIFPSNLNFKSTPVAIIALLNHQSSPVSGTAYLYYKTNLKRNGLDDIPASYSVQKEHYNYGGVTSQSTINAPTKPGYQILRAWNFTDLQPNEERHLFVSLDTTPSWQNISDLNTANYETEFLLFVRGNGVFAFEKEAVVTPILEISHDPAFLDVSFDPRESSDETTFDLLFYNEGSMPVRNIQVAFE